MIDGFCLFFIDDLILDVYKKTFASICNHVKLGYSHIQKYYYMVRDIETIGCRPILLTHATWKMVDLQMYF